MSQRPLCTRLPMAAIGTLLLATALLSPAGVQAATPQAKYIAAQGRVIPADGIVSVGVSNDGGTPLVASLNVKEGESIEEGKLLATLTTAPALQAAMAENAARLEAASAEVKSAEAQAALAKLKIQSAAQEKVLAQRTLEETLAALDVAEKSLAESIAVYQAKLGSISSTHEENRRILEKDSPPAREAAQLRYEQKQLDWQKAELAATQAGAELRLQAQVLQAQAAAATAQERIALSAIQEQAAAKEVAIAEDAIATAKQQAKVLEAALARTAILAQTATVTAPQAGTVLLLNARAGEAVPPQGLLQMANLGNLVIEAEVYIDDLRDVRLGQKATLTGEAFAGEFAGIVERIGNQVSLPEIFNRDPAAFTDKRVVRVRIRPEGALPSPLPVNSRILVRISR